ncbi:MAG: hypothetical protein ACRD4S_06380 [Candidatus Acidiferrales bacterium]
MSNQAYLGVWCKDFPEEEILDRFGRFLATVPFSASRPGFTQIEIRAVDPSETPVLEQDLRGLPLDAASIVEISRDHLHNDCSFEVRCCWDLWTFDSESGRSKLDPQTLEIFWRGEDYDSGIFRESGHFEVNLGFEHFFTGHARLLGFRDRAPEPAESPEEMEFLAAMAWPENLTAYQDKTRENIKKLFEWVRHIEKAVPVERVQMWSEGEENFEARLEEILAAR